MQRPKRQVKPWMVYLSATVLVALGIASYARRQAAVEPRIGVEWLQSVSGVQARSVEPGSPAWAAGVRPGDVLTRARGRAVGHALDAAQLGWAGAPGAPLELELRRGEETVQVSVRPAFVPTPPGAAVFFYLCLVGLAFVASGGFIALRWPGVRGATVYALLAASLFGVVVFSPTGRADLLDWTIFWLDLTAGAVAPALLLHLAMVVSRRALGSIRFGLLVAYAPAALLLIAAIWLVPLGGRYAFSNPVRALELRDQLQMLFLAFAGPVAAILFVRSYRRSASGLHRTQMRWLLWGLGAGLLPFTFLYALPWALGATPPDWTELSVLPMLFVPGAFTAALARYRLHDLDVLLRRGFTEVATVFLTLALYGVCQFVLRREEAGLIPLSNSAARYVGILVAAVSYPQLRAWVRVWVDRAFHRSRYSYRATLLDWARELNAETDLHAIVGNIRQRVRDTVGVPEARVLLRTGECSFEAPDPAGDIGVLLPEERVARFDHEPSLSVGGDDALRELPWVRYMFGMRVKGRLRAVLAVAERETPEEPLSSEDKALLSTLAAHAATAIEAARLVREVLDGAQEVQRLQARQNRILESSGVGLVLVDGEGTIVAWNRALEAIYGIPRGEALGNRLADVLPLHLVRAVESQIAAGAPGEEVRLFRYGLVSRTGQRVVANLTVSPAEGGARVIAVDDVTRQVKLEEQVIQQERLASLGLLAAGVAHEVNTPLTGISGYAQLLSEDLPESDPRRELLEKIETQTRRASNIANSLLDLARPQRNQLEELEVNDTLAEVLRLFEPQIRGRRIRVETRFEPDLPPVQGHRGKLLQVFLNLLLNARDAVGDEGHIQVVTRNGERRVVVEIVDDGVGIAEEDLPRIFDPFFTTKGRGKGTGLGLSITYGIVREHEGDIEVDSKPGERTRFRVILPAARAARISAPGI